MCQKFISAILSMVTAFLSLFGYGFVISDNSYPAAYSAEKTAVVSNENTQQIAALLDTVKAKTPSFKVLDEYKPFTDDDRIQAIMLEGENYNGKPAQVFAYIGYPENAAQDAKVPAIVLVHGGGGHAFADWVQLWVNRGYAAISVDCFGRIPQKGTFGNGDWTDNPLSHPNIDYFNTYQQPKNEQWYYYFLSDIILAGNILRADSRTDNSKIGVTGISWGGYAVSTLIGYDNRYAFAVPVYGCGYQQESTTITLEEMDKITDMWEPSLLLPSNTVPTLFVNSDSDIFFSANTTTKSAAASGSEILLKHEYGHSQSEGSEQEEIYRFADEHTGMGNGNMKITAVSIDGENAVAEFTLPDDALCCVNAKIYYRTTGLEYNESVLLGLIEKWQSKTALVVGDKISAKIPKGTTMFYISAEGYIGCNSKIYASTGVFNTSELA